MKISSCLKQMTLIASNSKIFFSSNAQKGFSISVYHGKYNEFNRVVCVSMKTVSSGAVGVSDGRLFEQMRAVVCLREFERWRHFKSL